MDFQRKEVMFDRKKYKKSALEQLRSRWNIPAIVTVLVILIIALVSYADNNSDGTIAFAISLCSLCISGILILAYHRLILKIATSSENIDMGDFFSGLEYWITGVLGFLWYTLWTTFWMLLFVIPGIIKTYAYSQMFWVLAENPKLGVKKAMNISKIMTNGHKADIFVMNLSFIGWILLSVITCGIGFVWLFPYMGASFANAYADMKLSSLREGKLTPADFVV